LIDAYVEVRFPYFLTDLTLRYGEIARALSAEAGTGLIRFLFACLAVATVWGQTITVSPATVEKGSANIFRIEFKPRSDKPVVALQWEMTPPRGIQIEAAGVVSGTATESAGKSVHCSNHANICLCILAGGDQAIKEGPIVIVKFTAAKDAPAGQGIVRIQKIQGVSADLQIIPIADAAATITVR
jgi:hypothetical protein